MAIVKINLVSASKKVQLLDGSDNIELSISGNSDLDLSPDEDHEIIIKNNNLTSRYPNGVTISSNLVTNTGIDGSYTPFSGTRQQLMVILSETIFIG